MSFFNELKRRNVFRVGAAYLVAAWLLLQVMDVISPLFDLPNAFGRGVFLLLAIGFPISLIAAWIFELTPAGLKTQDEADQSGDKSTSGKLNTVIIGGLVLVIILMAVDNYVLEDTPVTTITETSNDAILQDEITQTAGLENTLAVLPFANLSPDADQEYFADGLTEELLNKLAQVDGLLVAGRTSSFYFKGRNEDLREIGEQLNVNFLLEGSVRKAGDNLRITAQLIQANNGFHLWSNTYDRTLEDIFSIQDEIAEAVTTALSITLRAGEFDRPGMTNNVEAYDLFLQSLSDPDPVRRLDLAQQAIALDPDFALAWVAQSNANAAVWLVNPVEPASIYLDGASASVSRAAELAPDAIEVQLALASRSGRDNNHVDREAKLVSALEQAGNTDARALFSYGYFLASMGRLREALPYMQRVVRLEPLYRSASNNLSILYTVMGRTEEARQEYMRLQALGITENDNAPALMVAIENRDFPAIADLLDEVAWYPASTSLSGYFRAGNTQAAITELQRVFNDPGITPIGLFAAPLLLSALDDPEAAIDRMKDVLSPREGIMINHYWTDALSDARKLEGFKDVLRDEGMLEFYRVTGNWPDKCRPLEGNDDFECF